MDQPGFYSELEEYISTLEGEFDQIPAERKLQLAELATYIKDKKNSGQEINITVICTHNSRRSHMGQLWLLAAARYYGIASFRTFSGGTEATAFNTRAVKALRQAGYKIKSPNEDHNPVYSARIGPGLPSERMFSKKFSHPSNPQQQFAAIMVCSEADAACPYVPGADARFTIPYLDPKDFDGTPKEEEAYRERCRQIAREMFYAVDQARE